MVSKLRLPAKPLTLADVGEMIEWWHIKFGLEQWTVKVCTAALDGAAMRTTREVPYREAMVRVDPKVYNLAASEVQRLACHEMLHLAIAPLTDQQVQFFGEGVVRKALEGAEETAVDGLTSVLVRLIKPPKG